MWIFECTMMEKAASCSHIRGNQNGYYDNKGDLLNRHSVAKSFVFQSEIESYEFIIGILVQEELEGFVFQFRPDVLSN